MNISIDIKGEALTGVALEPYIHSFYYDQLVLLESLLQDILFNQSFAYTPLKSFFDMIFEKLQKIHALLSNEEPPKTPQNSNKQNIVT